MRTLTKTEKSCLQKYWEKKFKEEEESMDTDEEHEFIESFFAGTPKPFRQKHKDEK